MRQGLPTPAKLPAPPLTIILLGNVPTSRAVPQDVLTRQDQIAAHRQQTKQRTEEDIRAMSRREDEHQRDAGDGRGSRARACRATSEEPPPPPPADEVADQTPATGGCAPPVGGVKVNPHQPLT